MGRRRPPVDQTLPVTGLDVAIRYSNAALEYQAITDGYQLAASTCQRAGHRKGGRHGDR